MIELRSCLSSNVFSPCFGPNLKTYLYCTVKRVMPVDLPGRSHFWVHEILQVVEMQEKLVERGDEIAWWGASGGKSYLS